MTDTADLNLVLAVVKPRDALKERALARIRETRLVMPYSVGIELLFLARKMGVSPVDALGISAAHLEVERLDVLLTAAEALESGDVKTVFDAVHLADAFHRGGRLHTADDELQRTSFPTSAF